MFAFAEPVDGRIELHQCRSESIDIIAERGGALAVAGHAAPFREAEAMRDDHIEFAGHEIAVGVRQQQ